MKRQHRALLTAAILVSSPLVLADAAKLEQQWQTTGLAGPESVVFDPQLNNLYVSNVNGDPSAKDGNGYISIVKLDGRLVNEKWVIGLHAPKGLAIHGRTLYTADIDELVAIDIDTGTITRRHRVDDAKFLNDVAAAPNGDIFVSDMMLNRIHRLGPDGFTIWLESTELENPNGLLVHGDDLIVGSWGNMKPDWSTEVPGHLSRISLSDKSITSIGDGSAIGNLDGVEADDEGNFYVTDWMNGKLFFVSSGGTVEELLDLNQGSADHEVITRKGLLIIPMMMDNIMTGYGMTAQ